MIKILMIEDDLELAELLSDYLSRFSMEVDNYQTPDLGLSALNIKNYDLVILDLSLPDRDGVDVCKDINANHKIPIIISSARGDLADKVTCLGIGADDYMPKPYDPRELAARINSVLRRAKQENSPKKESDSSLFILDKEAFIIKKEQEDLKLTNAEFGILSYFIDHKNRAISREELISNIDAINYESSLKSIDVLIGRVRNKIEVNPKNPKFIVSIRGVGYRFNDE